jgi:hypothetical protein
MMVSVPTTESSDQQLSCSFCGKSQKEVRLLIAGPRAFICNECVEHCACILTGDPLFHLSQNPPTTYTSPVHTATAGHVLNCRLCQLPMTAAQAVLVPDRGPLCPVCVEAIEAAIGMGRDDPG